ncbi:MAG TPA: site-specific tyrosine recombinase/integron integrase [Candidatus Paceibacterota bacterium]
MTELEKYFEEYLNYLEVERGRSIKTRENYGRYLKAFFEWAKIKSTKDINLDLVRNFRMHLSRVSRGKTGNETGLKKNTQAYYIIAIRNFLKYLIKRDISVLAPDKIELPKMGMRQVELPHEEDLSRLLKTPDTSSLRGLRDKAILETFFSTGLRLSELCALGRYIDLGRGELQIKGKGGKLRLVFFSDDAKAALKNYLAKRDDTDPALFVSFTGNPKQKTPKVIGRITPRAVQRLINFYARKAGIQERVTPHMLRHMFATDLLINGADIRAVQELLGHSNIATTQVYTHLTDKGLREIHKAFHGKRS